jgi:hypothetical protein
MGDATKDQVWGYLGQLCARCHAGGISRSTADRPCAGLSPRFRRTDAQAPRAPRERGAALRAARPSWPRLPTTRSPRTSRTRSMRSARTGITARRIAARLVQGAVRDPARLRARPAHGQLHRALRHREQPPADRRSARLTVLYFAQAKPLPSTGVTVPVHPPFGLAWRTTAPVGRAVPYHAARPRGGWALNGSYFDALIQVSIFASSTDIGKAPVSSTCAWKARGSNFAPSSFCALALSLRMVSAPIL